ALIAVFILYAIMLVAYRPDDVFIYYRYAVNAAAGHGFVFNLHERVEGVTSLLWTSFLAIAAWLDLSLEVAAPVLSLFFGILVLWRLPKISAKLRGRGEVRIEDLIPSVLLCAMPSYAYWSYSGMETPLFAFLLVLAVETFLEDFGKKRFVS